MSAFAPKSMAAITEARVREENVLKRLRGKGYRDVVLISVTLQNGIHPRAIRRPGARPASAGLSVFRGQSDAKPWGGGSRRGHP